MFELCLIRVKRAYTQNMYMGQTYQTYIFNMATKCIQRNILSFKLQSHYNVLLSVRGTFQTSGINIIIRHVRNARVPQAFDIRQAYMYAVIRCRRLCSPKIFNMLKLQSHYNVFNSVRGTFQTTPHKQCTRSSHVRHSLDVRFHTLSYAQLA